MSSASSRPRSVLALESPPTTHQPSPSKTISGRLQRLVDACWANTLVASFIRTLFDFAKKILGDTSPPIKTASYDSIDYEGYMWPLCAEHCRLESVWYVLLA